MDRPIVYPASIPQDTDLLKTNQYAMTAMGMLAQAILGTSTVVDGLSCTPTTPASLSVNVSAGSIYSLQNLEASAYGSLPADTAHQIVKQGIILDTTNFACAAPATSGQSVVYLIQAQYQDADGGSTLLPYYNPSNPSVPYSGPANSGVSQNTLRQGKCFLNLKTGVAATTGTQVAPAPDAGYVGLWAITVANGQTTITSGNIAKASNAPFIGIKLPNVVNQAPVVGSVSGLKVARSTTTTLSMTASEAIVETAIGGATYKGTSLSLSLDIGTVGAGGMDTGSAAASTPLFVYLIYNPTTNAFALLATNSGTGNAVYPGANMPSGYTASAKISSMVVDGSSHIPLFAQRGGMVYILGAQVLTAGGATSLTAVSLNSATPPDTVSVGGWANCVSGTTPTIDIAGDANGVGKKRLTSAGNNETAFTDIPVLTSNNIYYLVSSGTFDLNISSYRLW